jgi:lipopolysaccharide export LptBFGC system permease protein LptF
MRHAGGRFLAVGGHIDRYVASLFFASYATSFLLVVGLFLVLDMTSNIDDFLEPWPDGGKAPAGILVRYYIINIPFLYMQAAPMVTLVAGMFTASKLVKHNETVACLAAGISAQRIMAPVFCGATLVAAGMFALREWSTSALGHKRDALLYVLEKQRLDRVYEGVWVRELSGSIVRLGEFRPATGSPPRAEVRELTANRGTTERWWRVEAPLAIWAEIEGRHVWWLQDGLVEIVKGAEEVHAAEVLEGFEFTPDLAMTYHRAQHNPMDLSLEEALDLARRDPDNVTYQTLIQYHLSFPLANLVLLLVGLPILMRTRRGKRMESLVIGALSCVFYMSADLVFRTLGLEGSLHPLLAGWVPLLFFGSLGVVLVDAMRT